MIRARPRSTQQSTLFPCTTLCRSLPYNSHVRVRAGYATTARTYRAELTGEFRGIVPPVVVSLRMRASGIDVLRFYGFGNETRDTSSSDFYKVKQQQYLVAPAL